MKRRLAFAFSLLVAPAFADIQAAIDRHILPGHSDLVAATSALATAAENDCTADTLKLAFSDAYDTWISVSHIQFGPIEEQGLGLAMSFWPDPKDSTAKAIARLTSAKDPIVESTDFGEVSAAAQGFTALERLLFDPQPDAGYACRLTQAVANGLADKAQSINAAWPGFAGLMTETGNDRFQSGEEVNRALYTALSSGLEFLHDQRLGRPLGSFERPRPRRAEARRSERSLRHIDLSLAALEELATTFYQGDLTQTKSAFADARARASALDDPALTGVAEPSKRIRIEALQRTVRDIQNAVNTEIGKPLGITAGFNSLDGD